MQTFITTPPIPAGNIKIFTPFGAKLGAGKPVRQLEYCEWMVKTREKAEACLDYLTDAPEGH